MSACAWCPQACREMLILQNKRMSQDTFTPAVFTGSLDLLGWVLRFRLTVSKVLDLVYLPGTLPTTKRDSFFLALAAYLSNLNTLRTLNLTDSSWRLACFLLSLLLRTTVFRLWTGEAEFLCAATADYCSALYALYHQRFLVTFFAKFSEERNLARHSSK